MAHVEDRWYKDLPPGPDGKPRKERTARHGKGLRWRARYLDPDGAERGRSFPTRVLAERFLTEVEHSKLAGSYRDPDAGKVTLRRYSAERLAAYHADSTRAEKIRQQLDNHILPGLGHRTLAQLADRPTLVTQFFAGLTLSLATKEQVFVTLSSILGAAVEDGLIGKNPCKATSVQRPKPVRRKIVPWTAAQVAALREGMPGRWAATVDCGAGLGLRQGEILGAGPDEIDFLRRVVHVRRQVKHQGGRLWFAAPKGGRERDVPLAERPALALSAQIAEHPPVAVTLPWHDPGSRRHGQPVTAELLFTHHGTAVNSSTFNTLGWRPARKSAGIAQDGSRTGMHALRHYYASALLADGVDVRALSEYLGHHDPAITLRIYTHLMPSAEGKALRAIDRAFAEQDRAAAEHDHGPVTAQDGAERP